MEIKEHILLAPYTNFRVGGPARYFIEAKTRQELEEAARFAKEKSLSVAVLGGGTNVLVCDAGFSGLVVRMACAALHVSGSVIHAESGCTMGQVVSVAQRAGLAGIEWAAGLPGTVGGAVFGNAGCFGGETRDVVESVEVMDPGTLSIKAVPYAQLSPAYRYTRLHETGEIVLSAAFTLHNGDARDTARMRDDIRSKARERIAEQPLGARTAGSTFRGVKITEDLALRIRERGLDAQSGMNRRGLLSAGWLIERAGLKGVRVGGASFSGHHANFIINDGSASAADIAALITEAKRRVREMFGIELEEEVRYIGF